MNVLALSVPDFGGNLFPTLLNLGMWAFAGYLVFKLIRTLPFTANKDRRQKEASERVKNLASLDSELEDQIADLAIALGVSKSEAKQAAILGNHCPRCKKFDFYIQPITISRRVRFATVNDTYNIRFCTNCNVEFMPRVLL